MSKLDYINAIFNSVGLNLERYNYRTNSALRRNSLFNRYNISLIIDVGANAGYFGREIIKAGYNKKIISFEPIESAFNLLKKDADKNENWEIYNYALGAEETEAFINISENSCSSSILNILDCHTKAEKSASYIDKQKIFIKTLDSFIEKLNFKNYKEIF